MTASGDLLVDSKASFSAVGFSPVSVVQIMQSNTDFVAVVDAASVTACAEA